MIAAAVLALGVGASGLWWRLDAPTAPPAEAEAHLTGAPLAEAAPAPAPIVPPLPDAPPAKPARLTLKSVPPGASVRVDGRPLGVTPLELSLSVSEAHFLTVEKAGFRRDEREVPRGVGTLEVKLVKLAQAAVTAAPAPLPVAEGPGYLTLSTSPWTKVSVGGDLLGSTPLYKARLSAGTQTLTLVNEGKGINTTRTVVIKPGEVTRIELKL